MRGKLVGALVLCAAGASLLPTTALAGSFTRPVRLPAVGEWVFAVNDRGQALGAYGDLVYPVERSGRLGRPWKVTVSGGFAAIVGSLVVDDRGRVAAGLVYSDKSVPRGEGEYGSPACCERAAVASWKLGTKPPVAHVLASPGQSYYYESGRAAPRVVLGPTAVTALWGVGETSPSGAPPVPGGEPGEAQLYEAFGPFGGQLQTRELVSFPKGVQSVHLALDRAGDAVAAWRDDEYDLGVDRGARSGALPPPAPGQSIAGIVRTDEDGQFAEEGNEFSNDDRGDTVFAYASTTFGHKGKLLTMTSVDGGRFGAARAIARLQREHDPPTVVLGGDRSFLALWECASPSSECGSTWERRGSIFGALSAPFELSGFEADGFVDARGGSLIAYRRARVVEAIVAQPGQPFGPPHRLSSANECELGAGTDNEPPPASSANGAAILYYTCGGLERSYLVRYTP